VWDRVTLRACHWLQGEVAMSATRLSDGAWFGRWVDYEPSRKVAEALAASLCIRSICFANTAPAAKQFKQFHFTSDVRACCMRDYLQSHYPSWGPPDACHVVGI
jgi:hypothetical protein